MCAVIGALLWNVKELRQLREVNAMLSHIIAKSHERGRDGRGFISAYEQDGKWSARTVNKSVERCDTPAAYNHNYFSQGFSSAIFLCNLRAEPTTEYVKAKQKEDQQPYCVREWSIVHNGTIANDKIFRNYNVDTSIDSAAIVEHLVDSDVTTFGEFVECVQKFEGSYAIIAHDASRPGALYCAANYRPLWYVGTDNGVFIASSKDYFPSYASPRMVEPYTAMEFTLGTPTTYFSRTIPLRAPVKRKRALVVCSGGMDSVVAATICKAEGYEVTLLHWQYGSRPELREAEAVVNCAHALGVRCIFKDLNVWDKGASPLLDKDSPIAGGEEGAEFAHEWVPARNLVMLAIATAYAERNGFDTIVLGNNLEEAGAYPDNEPEFINKFNEMLHFAVNPKAQIKVLMPVGNMMKHEIVAVGLALDAPLHKTWSCYKAGKHHCGKCGPCYMRRVAFKINSAVDPIEYLE